MGVTWQRLMESVKKVQLQMNRYDIVNNKSPSPEEIGIDIVNNKSPSIGRNS